MSEEAGVFPLVGILVVCEYGHISVGTGRCQGQAVRVRSPGHRVDGSAAAVVLVHPLPHVLLRLLPDDDPAVVRARREEGPELRVRPSNLPDGAVMAERVRVRLK